MPLKLDYLTNLIKSLKGKGLRSLSIDTLWTITAQLVAVVFNILIVYFLANLLSPNDFGQYKLATTWLAVAIGFGYTGYFYILPQKYAKQESLDLKVYIYKTLLKTSPVVCFTLAASCYYFHQQNINLAISFLLISFAAPASLIYTLCNSYFIGTKKFYLSSIAQTLTVSFQAVSVIAAAIMTNSFIYAASALLISTIMANMLVVRYVYIQNKKYIATNSISLAETNTEEVGANKLNITTIFSGLVYQADKLLLFHFVGAAELAIYTICLAIADQSRAPFKTLSTVFSPRISDGSFNKRQVLKIFISLTGLSSILTLLIIFINPILFKYIFPKYIDYVYLANVAAISMLFSAGPILVAYLQGHKNFDSINNNQVLMTVLMLVLYPVAIFYKSVLLLIILRNVVVGICSGYLLYKVLNFKE